MSDTRIFTAQIRQSDNVVQAVTASFAPLEATAGMIFVTLTDYHPEYAGWTYNPADGSFTPPAPPS
jgi:hypothetical protein